MAKKIILYFSRNTIKAAPVILGSHPAVEKTIDYEYSVGALTEALKKIKNDLKIDGPVRILLDDSLSYIVDLAIPKNIADERKYLAEKIQDDIPEILENPDWDFKEVGSDKDEKRVLVFAPVKDFFVKLSWSLKEIPLQVEAIEPVSLALRRASDPIIGLAKKKDIKGKDEEVLNMKPKDVKIEPVEEEVKTPTVPEEEAVEKTVDEPVKKVVDSSEEASNIITVESKSMPEVKPEEHIFEEEKSVEPEEKSSKKWLVIFLVFVILVVAAGLAYYFLVVKKASAPLPEGKTPTAETTVTVTPTSAPVNLADYKIKILNGSGIAGQAGVVEEILKEEGFTDFATGNADNYDYEATEVSLKENIPDKVFEAINRALNSKYKVEKQAKAVAADADYAILIVVGVKNDK